MFELNHLNTGDVKWSPKWFFAIYQSGWRVARGSHAAVSFTGLDSLCHHARIVRICSPLRFCGCLGTIWAQSCNLDWQQIAYNQPKKLFWTAKNDQWGDLREKPDEFTDWEKRTHTHSILFIRADGNICAVDSEHRAGKTLCSLLFVLSTLRGLARQPMINMSHSNRRSFACQITISSK